MAGEGIGDYFVTDMEDDFDDDLLTAPVVVPQQPAAAPAPAQIEPAAPAAPEPVSEPTVEPTPEPPSEVPGGPPTEAGPVARPAATTTQASREQRLATSLDSLMEANPDIQATALVSLDGFTMASALPTGMQEDRVGAMSAAILGLGERAAAELGRGELDQVYIEGSDGIVVLVSAGGRAVLTALAGDNARLGLVIYDMRAAAAEIGQILG